MDKKNLDIAKNLFYKYNGNHYQMVHDDIYAYYKSFKISNELEKQWRIEIIESLKKNLYKTCNNKELASKFILLCEYIVQLKNIQDLYFLLDFVKKSTNKYDSNTLFKNINALLNSASIISNSEEKKKFILSCLEILNNILNDEIIISTDYMENEKFPDYLSIEKLSSKIKDTINYYLKLLK